MKKQFDREKNFRQRLEFVHFWAEYVKRTPNAVWSKQHSDFINSVLRGANQDRELYMRVLSKIQGTKKQKKI